jgi:hypothetical protein
MDNDLIDAQWHQQELEERQRWEQHRQTVRAFREWSIKEGYIRENKPNGTEQISQERGLPAT